MKKTILILFHCMSFLIIYGQTHVQNVRGKVVDNESLLPLIGANVSIISSQDLLGTSTDEDGYFDINQVPIGRHTFSISYLGYEPVIIQNILVTTGKEVVLDINMTESLSNHVWMAFMVLCGFTVSWTIFAKSITTNPPFLSAIIGFVCIIGIYYLTIILKDRINIDYNFQWVVVGILIPLTARIAGNYRIKK